MNYAVIMADVFDRIRPQAFAPVRVKDSVDINHFFSELRQRKLSKGLNLNSLKLTQKPLGPGPGVAKRDIGVSLSGKIVKTSKKTPTKGKTSNKKNQQAKSAAKSSKTQPQSSAGAKPKSNKKKAVNLESRIAEAKL